ncbi:MAG: hypothetical protein WC661_12110 [Opitutaceae bacterium]|jgi:hypothetical protein
MKSPLLASLALFVLLAGCSVFPEIESKEPKPFDFRAPLDLRLTTHYIRTTENYPQKEYWWYGGREDSPGFMIEHRQHAIIVITYYTNSDFDRDKSGSGFPFGPTADTFHPELREYQNINRNIITLRKDFKTEEGVYCLVGVLERDAITEKSFDSDLVAMKDSINHFRQK